jgi:decaprenyl-phosphate phosphoribosyltransferase
MNIRSRFPFLVALRPHHWVKNLLVFAGIFFAHQWDNPTLIIKAALLFFAFSFTASGIYLINDHFDRSSDRLHPLKRHRPLAAGLLDPRIAMLKAHGLLALGWVLAYYTGHALALILLIAYTMANLLYSKWLKHTPILDVTVLASSYLFRVSAGTEGLGIHISSWMLLCSLSVALMLGFGKRLSEKHLLELAHQRNAVKIYSEEFLRMAITITATLFLVFYGLYTLDASVVAFHGSKLIFTYPWVLMLVFRYLQLSLDKNPLAEDPATLFWRDRPLFQLTIIWFASFTAIVLW